MSWLDAGRHWLRVLFRRRDMASDMDDEVSFHLEMEAMHRRHDGAGASEAFRQARLRFGSPVAVREKRRRASGLAVIDRIRQDVSYAVRQLRRTPGFTAAVVFTFALGIGANATMFTIVDHVMLRAPAGIVDAGRVVQLREWQTLSDGSRDSLWAQSYPSYVEFRKQTDVFTQVTAVAGPRPMPVGRGPGASRAMGALVADDYFMTLGVRPAAGRFFAGDETRAGTGEGPAVVVLGSSYAARRFGEPSAAVSRTLVVAGTRYTVVGVAPRYFSGHSLVATDFWLPIAGARALRFGGPDWATQRGTLWLSVIARLRKGITPARAVARAQASWTAWKVSDAATARAPALYTSSLVPAESAARPEQQVARLLAIVSLFLLFIACANVANLLLARSLQRRREIAVRLALGMSRRRLAALLAADAMLLAFLGGAAALLVAHWGVPLVRAVLFAGTATAPWPMDLRLVLFTVVTACVGGLIAGVVPALQARRPALTDALHVEPGEGGGALRRSRTRAALLVAQGALSLTLLAGSGLFARSLQRVMAQPLGLDLDRVLVVQMESWRDEFSNTASRAIYDAMRNRTRSLPGVESTSLSVGAPFLGQYALPLELPGRDSLPGLARGAAPFIYAVTPDFFATMGTRIVRGRGLRDTDDAHSSVAIVSESMARLFWPDVDPIGRCFKIVIARDTPDCTRVVGVAEDARRNGLVVQATRDLLQYYMPLSEAPPFMTETLLLVRASNPAAVRAALPRALHATRPDLPFVDVQTLEDLVAPELRPWRLGAEVLGLFGVLALVVAGIGTYSVMQFGVSQRLHEIGVRVALGAGRSDIVRLVLREGLIVMATATACGIALSLALGPLIREQLFQTSPRDPVVLASGVAVLVLCGLAASVLPAWRATRIDPARTLRTD